MFNGGTKQFQQIPTVASGLEGTESSDVQLASKAYVDSILTGRELVAWVNFNGTGTVAIRASYNVSSITDNGTGNYTVNFATVLPDADYCVVAMAGDRADNYTIIRGESSIARSASSFTVGVLYQTSGSPAYYDADHVQVAVFR